MNDGLRTSPADNASSLIAAPSWNQERLRWIESWAQGWRETLTARYGDPTYYAEMPLDVAVSMINELALSLRTCQAALCGTQGVRDDYKAEAEMLRAVCLPVVERYAAHWCKDDAYYAAADALGIEEPGE